MSLKYSGNNVLTKIFQLIKSKFDGLATVATSGSYNDLTDKPDTAEIVRATTSVSTNGTTTIAIPITINDTTKLTVYQNGLLLTPTVHYTATTSTITLVSYAASAGDIFTFVGSSVSGTSLNVSAASVLFSDTTEDNCYKDCATVQDALIHSASWRPKITEIRLNGNSITPDNGVVDLSISIPSVPIKSISLNSTPVSPDSNGNIALLNILKTTGGTMTGPLILSAAPTNNMHPATKKYVDDLIGDVNTVISNINSLIGGT